MLEIMEDESKFFVAWLIKFIKINKKITGKNLAEKIGVSQPTVAGYMSGRTKPNFKIRQAILKATGVSHEEMLQEGRKQLQPQVKRTGESEFFTKAEAESRFADIEAKLETKKLKSPLADDQMTTDLFYKSLATQYVDEALAETGTKITPKQRGKFINITKEDMQKTIKQTKVNIKKHLEIFEDEE